MSTGWKGFSAAKANKKDAPEVKKDAAKKESKKGGKKPDGKPKAEKATEDKRDADGKSEGKKWDKSDWKPKVSSTDHSLFTVYLHRLIGQALNRAFISRRDRRLNFSQRKQNQKHSVHRRSWLRWHVMEQGHVVSSLPLTTTPPLNP